MITRIDLSQEILAIDMPIFAALKSSLEHSHRHVMRSLRLFRTGLTELK